MTIQPFILDRQDQVAELCRQTGAKRLDVFGSAVRADFSDTSSDIDFLVEFDHATPAEYAEAYFTLKEGLERLFKRNVDLLTNAALQNPYLRSRVESERQPVYAD